MLSRRPQDESRFRNSVSRDTMYLSSSRVAMHIPRLILLAMSMVIIRIMSSYSWSIYCFPFDNYLVFNLERSYILRGKRHKFVWRLRSSLISRDGPYKAKYLDKKTIIPSDFINLPNREEQSWLLRQNSVPRWSHNDRPLGKWWWQIRQHSVERYKQELLDQF